MNESQIRQEVINVLREIVRKPDAKIEDDTKLINDLGLESIDFVDMVFECERRIGIEIELSQFSIKSGDDPNSGFQEMVFKDLLNIVTELMKMKESGKSKIE